MRESFVGLSDMNVFALLLAIVKFTFDSLIIDQVHWG